MAISVRGSYAPSSNSRGHLAELTLTVSMLLSKLSNGEPTVLTLDLQAEDNLAWITKGDGI